LLGVPNDGGFFPTLPMDVTILVPDRFEGKALPFGKTFLSDLRCAERSDDLTAFGVMER